MKRLVLLAALLAAAGCDDRKRQEAGLEGAKAALDGVPPETCPYNHNSVYYGDWKRGWAEGYREKLRREKAAKP